MAPFSVFTACVLLVLGASAYASSPAALALANRLQGSGISYSKVTDSSAKGQVDRFLTTLEKAYRQLEGALSVEADETYRLPEIREQLRSDQPDLTVLDEAYRAMCSNLEQPVDFASKREWLQIRSEFKAVLRMLRARSEAQGLSELSRRVSEMVADLRSLAIARDEATEGVAFTRLAANFRWCAERNQIPDQLGWIRTHFRNPNQVIAMSDRLLARKLNMSLPPQSMPVNEFNKGFHIRGQGTGTANLLGSFHPNPTRAEIRVLLDGVANAGQLEASRNRLSLSLGSYSKISGYVTLYVDEKLNVQQGPQSVSVSTSTQIKGAHVETRKLFPNRRGERLLFNGSVREAIAMRVAQQNVPQMNAETAAKIQSQLSSQISQEFGKQLQTMQSGEMKEKLDGFKKLAKEQFDFPLDRQDLFPRISLRTDAQNLFLQGTFGPEEELTAASPHPHSSAAGTDSDVRGFVHESLFNQFSRFLEGTKVEEENFREMFFTKLGLTIPPEFDVTGDNPAWLTMADVEPYTVKIQSGEIIATIRLKAFKAEKKVYRQNPVTVTVRYRPSIAVNERGERGGVQMDRLGEVEVTAPTSVEIEAMKSIADRFFVRRAVAHGITMGDELKLKQPIGRFLAKAITASRGWIAVGWQLQEQGK